MISLVGEVDLEEHALAHDAGRDARGVADRLERLLELPAEGVHPLVGPGPLQDPHGGEPGRRGDRVAAQRADLRDELLPAHAALVEVRHELLAARDGRQRKAAAHRLAERAEVRRDAVELLGAAVGEPERR